MRSHVTGQPTLGQQRQALLAVVADNPLFSPQKQLQLNHQAHECGELTTLTQQLHGLRHEAARRQRVAALRRQATADPDQAPVCLNALTQLAEMELVLTASGPWRDAQNRRSFYHFVQVLDPTLCVRILGEAYLGLLEHRGLLTGKRN